MAFTLCDNWCLIVHTSKCGIYFIRQLYVGDNLFLSSMCSLDSHVWKTDPKSDKKRLRIVQQVVKMDLFLDLYDCLGALKRMFMSV